MDDRQLLDEFTNMVRIHTAYIDRQLSFLNLKNGQGGVISALGKNGSLSQNELAKFRQVTPATISIMLDRMERDGLVLRQRDGSSGRANQVTLTDRGQKLYERLQIHMEKEPEVVFHGLTQEEKDTAAVIIRKISDNLAE